MFNNNSINNFLDSKIDSEMIALQAKEDDRYQKEEKKAARSISHKKVLDIIHK